MAFPPPVLPTDNRDDTPSAFTHPDLHNDVNQAVNDIVVVVQNLQTRVEAIDGVERFYGEGPPVDPILGASPGDEYVDTVTGDLYVLQ